MPALERASCEHAGPPQVRMLPPGGTARSAKGVVMTTPRELLDRLEAMDVVPTGVADDSRQVRPGDLGFLQRLSLIDEPSGAAG